jgi:ribosomal protein S14
MELAKFHEERGKIKCPCYSCEAKETIRKEVKGKIDKELKELEQAESEKGECNECGKVRVLDEENGLCRQCLKNYEG